MKIKYILLIIICVSILLFSCDRKVDINVDDNPVTNIEYAGLRASTYGIKPFPEPDKWVEMIKSMEGYFEGSKPVVVWILGIIDEGTSCRLHFPSEGNSYKNIVFDNEDLSERYLDYFDRNNINVYLQVEPADADVETLIDLVLNRYGNHSSVVGFGVDVEWYEENSHKEWGKKLDDKTAELWEAKVKSYNPDYKLFVKHWDLKWLAPEYRGDIVFVDDSQIFDRFEQMKSEFVEWGNHFYPNEVWFQIGYSSDEKWWSKFDTPPQYMGRNIASDIKQKVGIVWVDFTLKKIFPF